jgi:hypothetical protein
MHLEQDLKRVLRREAPPAGFAGRVLDRIEREQRKPRRHWWRAAAASVTLVAAVAGWSGHRMAERRRAEGERARQEVLLALQIASEKVRYAQDEVRNIGHNE